MELIQTWIHRMINEVFERGESQRSLLETLHNTRWRGWNWYKLFNPAAALYFKPLKLSHTVFTRDTHCLQGVQVGSHSGQLLTPQPHHGPLSLFRYTSVRGCENLSGNCHGRAPVDCAKWFIRSFCFSWYTWFSATNLANYMQKLITVFVFDSILCWSGLYFISISTISISTVSLIFDQKLGNTSQIIGLGSHLKQGNRFMQVSTSFYRDIWMSNSENG